MQVLDVGPTAASEPEVLNKVRRGIAGYVPLRNQTVSEKE